MNNAQEESALESAPYCIFYTTRWCMGTWGVEMASPEAHWAFRNCFIQPRSIKAVSFRIRLGHYLVAEFFITILYLIYILYLSPLHFLPLQYTLNKLLFVYPLHHILPQRTSRRLSASWKNHKKLEWKPNLLVQNSCVNTWNAYIKLQMVGKTRTDSCSKLV